MLVGFEGDTDFLLIVIFIEPLSIVKRLSKSFFCREISGLKWPFVPAGTLRNERKKPVTKRIKKELK